MRSLSLDDRPRLEKALAHQPLAPSEYCFANLFLFRGRHNYAFSDLPVPHIRGVTYDGEVHALPLTTLDAAAAEALLSSGVTCLYPIGEAAPSLADRFDLVCDARDADRDYWYDGSAMSELRLAKVRRGQARNFENAAGPVIEHWNATLAEEARAILHGWMADVGRPMTSTDFAECEEAIKCSEALGLEGALVRTRSGEPVSFLLASSCADSGRVVHFAKGRRAHSGAYPWMFSQYARKSGARLLNFEQDLGNPGLARSKQAYSPIERRAKYRLRRRPN